ncbi:hypothetical protein D3C73_173340 [compost metagenome]|jgi:hypothetical protein
MKAINHTRNAARFAVVVFWVVILGLAYTAFQNSGNSFSLGWGTWLFYAVVTIVVLYAGVVYTIKLWSFK